MDSTPQPIPEKQCRLARIQRFALGLLVFMAALFLAARLWERSFPWLGWVQAFAEAAMVGALADWFAVVALFRHPFGLPIPHTAILPTRKAQLARALGLFVVDNFLSRQVVQGRLSRVDFVALAVGLLNQEASSLAGKLCRVLPRVLDLLNQQEVTNFIHVQLQRQMGALPLAPIAGKLLEMLTAGGKHEALLDEVLRQCERLLEEQQEAIKENVERELPLPDDVLGISLKMLKAPLASYVAGKIVTKVLTLLHAAGRDHEHPVRQRFTARVQQLVTELKESPEYLAKGEALKADMLANPALRSYAGSVWAEIRAWILSQTSHPEAGFQGKLEVLLNEVSQSLARDPAFAQSLNNWLRDALASLVETHRLSFGRTIEETVNAWDPREMSDKLELEVGADLQFIRINGTLIGGLVGVLIYAISRLLPQW